jgi:GT2 family glycosyltransferase
VGVSVASVTTAYNSARVLPGQIEALLRQTRPLQEIVVVDDGSTDGTVGMLSERYPQVKVIRTPQNLGTAGAWALGLAYAALERHHDWIWTFDDDSMPSDDTLGTLLNGVECLGRTDDNVGMIAPLLFHRGTGISYLPLLWHHGFVTPSDEVLRQPMWFADLVLASGSMIRRDVVEKIGLPRADFFMDFADFEYCLRSRSSGYKIAIITEAKLAHERGSAREVRVAGYSRLWPDYAPWREYYISRSLAYAAWWLYPDAATKRFVVRHLLRHAGGSLLFGSRKLACLRKMAEGFWDGRHAKLGIRFRPDLS